MPSAGVVTFGRGALLGLVLVCGASGAVAGQRRLRVTGQRSLAFGTMLPGLSRSVSRTDPLNSGMFNVQASRFLQIQLVFSLPTVMQGPGGATLPLSFGADDAGFSASQSVASQIGFDPRAGFVATMGARNQAAVFLGGTATPQASQRAGSYTGTVTLTVVYLP